MQCDAYDRKIHNQLLLPHLWRRFRVHVKRFERRVAAKFMPTSTFSTSQSWRAAGDLALVVSVTFIAQSRHEAHDL